LFWFGLVYFIFGFNLFFILDCCVACLITIERSGDVKGALELILQTVEES
jgi:hypothetical protein